jgi:colanic acid biosynthesis protein WcaH
MFISDELYKQMLLHLPILCVDLIIQNSDDEYLLVKRDNHPIKGYDWVPGGRMLKNVDIPTNAQTKCKQELGLEITDWRVVGIYDDQYDTNAFNLDTKIHTLSVLCRTGVRVEYDQIKLDEQSSEIKYSKLLPELLRQRYEVFENDLIAQKL